MPNVVLTSFHGSVDTPDNGWQARQDLLHRTARSFGKVDGDIQWSRDDLVRSGYYRRNQDVLDEPRGGGLWAWKPWAILSALEQVSDGDFVIYHDVGKPFREGDPARGGSNLHGNVIELPVESIIHWAEDHDGMFPGVNTPHYGPASQWTKRDCFIGMDCDRKEVWQLPLVQAGYNAWKKSPRVIEFLNLWLESCSDRRLISDDPNTFGKPDHPDFSEHRHDQSVLTNLIRREGLQAYGSETDATPYVRNFNYLIRRVGLDRAEADGEQTLTKRFEEQGGSKNLTIGVTSWIDLDVVNRDRSELNVLCIRNGSNPEESTLASHFSASNWQVVDCTDQSPERLASIGQNIAALTSNFDWVFAYGFTDQSLLVYLTRVAVPKLKPAGFMIAGLDHSLHFVKDNTFDTFIKQLGRTRELPPSVNSDSGKPMSLLVGTATNPVQSKKRRDKVIIASIQAGIESSTKKQGTD